MAMRFTPTELCRKRVSTLRARRFSSQYWISHIVQYVLNVKYGILLFVKLIFSQTKAGAI